VADESIASQRSVKAFTALQTPPEQGIDVVEFLDLTDAIGFDPRDAIKQLRAIQR